MADPVIRSIGLCAGVGMLDLGLSAGLEYLGIRHRTIAYCEREAYAASQLLALMESECLDAAPIWPDLTTFPASEFRGVVDCITAGFPCQPHSVAGKREGTDDARWIWPAIVGIIRDSGAWLVVLENVRGLLSSGGMAPVLADLADLGFAAEWTVLGAGEVGASHKRERVFIVGVANGASGRFRELRQSSGRDGQPDGSNEDMDYAEGGEHQGIGETPDAWIERVHRVASIDMAHPARHGGDGSHRQSGSGRGVCGDGGEVADALCAGRQQIARGAHGDEGADEGRSSQHDHVAAGRSADGLASPSSGLLPQPWRGAQGRDGAGSAVAVLEYAASARPAGRRSGESGPVRDEARRGESSGRRDGMADTSGAGSQGTEQRGTRDIDRGGQEAHGPTEQLREIFAPGPSDPRWPGIIRERPDLAPAVESSVRSLAHGMAGMVDESRRDQLRAIGNGVCPLQAAVAIVALVNRLKG